MDDVKKAEGSAAWLKRKLRGFLNAASDDDARFGGIGDRLKEIEIERQNLADLVSEVTALRDKMKEELMPRGEVSLSPFFFFIIIFLLSTILGGVLFARGKEQLYYSYLSYVLPLAAALLSGAVIYFNKNYKKFLPAQVEIFVKFDVFLYQFSAVLLCAGLVAFVISADKGIDFLWGMFFPPGFASSIFYFGLRLGKWKGIKNGWNTFWLLFSMLLLIASFIGLIWWLKIVSEIGTCEIRSSLVAFWVRVKDLLSI